MLISNRKYPWKQVKTSHTWVRFTSWYQFKLRDASSRTRLAIFVVRPTFPDLTPVGSNTSGVSDTWVETLFLCCRRLVRPSEICTHVVIYNPARWTASSRRRCCRSCIGVKNVHHVVLNSPILLQKLCSSSKNEWVCISKLSLHGAK